MSTFKYKDVYIQLYDSKNNQLLLFCSNGASQLTTYNNNTQQKNKTKTKLLNTNMLFNHYEQV